ncbi:LLM class flavin-dependent oxidoreductase [Pseudofrankia saprophytica]|uniref:LLM class flavin-dependent oxidoreductase n=1 Tax=Pseudofrankia saprophytica TaxID=298655 RepID=UPI000234B62B|nr:LLM class flavin-dependent oxidoreductase [Pseudofrankia saprophytica]
MAIPTGPAAAGPASAGPRVGLRVPRGLFTAGLLPGAVARAEDAGLDLLAVGDHVTFHGGQGGDGLVQAAALAALARRARIAVSVYQLALRHPVAVARQLVDVAALAPGGLSFGVGAGGEDRAEVAALGVDPATRGRRLDESLAVLRRLLTGEPVDHEGPFFSLSGVAVRPAPSRPVPIIVGGRSDAALRRAALHGDGWLGVWVSPRRFAEAVGQVETIAADAGRAAPAWRHGLQVWCGFGADPRRAAAALAAEMEGLYGLPFERFARWCPAGRPDDVAEFLAPYVAAGAGEICLIAAAGDPMEAVAGAAAVRGLLRA